MLVSRALIRKNLAVGPGGTACHCCFPGGRSRRKAKFRSAKRKETRIAFKIEAAND